VPQPELSYDIPALSDLLGLVSTWSTETITGAAGLHLVFFMLLVLWARRDLRAIAQSLDDFTRPLNNRSILGARVHLSDQIEAFIADVNDLLNDPARTDERKACLKRMTILDERRRYLDSLRFETAWNSCRTMIEAYPLAGVLGTILAIGAALHGQSSGAMGVSVASIVGRFGDAIWSTFAGLAAAILLMFINSLVETRFRRLTSNREHVREMVARAKRELSLSAAGTT